MEDETRAAIVARAGVVVVGIASLAYGASMLDNVFGLLGVALGHGLGKHMAIGNMLVLIGAFVGPLLLLAAGVILIRQADAISRRFVGRYVVSMEVVLYRIVLAVMGLYFITVGITNGLTLLNNVVIHYFSDLPDELAIGPRGFWPFALLAGANTGIGLYFFLGAPRLLGWHLKRCREVMSENATEADIAGPGRMDGVGQ